MVSFYSPTSIFEFLLRSFSKYTLNSLAIFFNFVIRVPLLSSIICLVDINPLLIALQHLKNSLGLCLKFSMSSKHSFFLIILVTSLHLLSKSLMFSGVGIWIALILASLFSLIVFLQLSLNHFFVFFLCTNCITLSANSVIEVFINFTKYSVLCPYFLPKLFVTVS